MATSEPAMKKPRVAPTTEHVPAPFRLDGPHRRLAWAKTWMYQVPQEVLENVLQHTAPPASVKQNMDAVVAEINNIAEQHIITGFRGWPLPHNPTGDRLSPRGTSRNFYNVDATYAAMMTSMRSFSPATRRHGQRTVPTWWVGDSLSPQQWEGFRSVHACPMGRLRIKDLR